MRNKSRKALPKPKLQHFVLEPITDPAEQAALDQRCQQAEKMLSPSAADGSKSKSGKHKESRP